MVEWSLGQLIVDVVSFQERYRLYSVQCEARINICQIILRDGSFNICPSVFGCEEKILSQQSLSTPPEIKKVLDDLILFFKIMV